MQPRMEPGCRRIPLSQAAPHGLRNLPTSSLSRLLSPDSDCAADRTCARPIRFRRRRAHVGDVGRDLLGALRRLLHVAGDLLRRRALLFHGRRDGRGDLRQLLDGAVISLMASTNSRVAAWMPAICWPISPVALAVCSASALTSEATTAKPRPASPARAASMVALSASRLVCPAMVLISSTTSPIGPPPSTIRRRGRWSCAPGRRPHWPSAPIPAPAG